MVKKTTKKPGRFQKPRPVPRNCIYCREDRDPDWKNFEELSQFVSERGRILPSTRTGLCAKHQRRIALAIKRARFMALLPYVAGIK